jgi:hypothetical protein
MLITTDLSANFLADTAGINFVDDRRVGHVEFVEAGAPPST